MKARRPPTPQTPKTPLLHVRGALAALTAATAALLAAATPAVCAAPAPPKESGWAYVAVVRGEDARGDVLRGALLRCPATPAHATPHAHAAEACAELAAADGDIDRVPPAHALCSMVYAPVTAYAFGVWNGHRVTYRHTFANSCVLDASTGSVFATDR